MISPPSAVGCDRSQAENTGAGAARSASVVRMNGEPVSSATRTTTSWYCACRACSSSRVRASVK
jgi:hypothetical protein